MTPEQSIRYGMFIMPFHPPEKPTAQCYDEDLELIVLAEELGFSEFWIGEHHTMKYENIVMPEIFIGRALGETKTIRLGPAPVCGNQVVEGGEECDPVGSLTCPASSPGGALLESFSLSVWVYRGADWLVRDPEGPHVAKEARTVQFEPSVVDDFDGVADVAKIVGVSDDFDAVAAAAEATRAELGAHAGARRAHRPARVLPVARRGDELAEELCALDLRAVCFVEEQAVEAIHAVVAFTEQVYPDAAAFLNAIEESVCISGRGCTGHGVLLLRIARGAVLYRA